MIDDSISIPLTHTSNKLHKERSSPEILTETVLVSVGIHNLVKLRPVKCLVSNVAWLVTLCMKLYDFTQAVPSLLVL